MITRGSSLSDDRVIAMINKNFVPIELNITDQGFPKNIKGLKPWERAYNSARLFHNVFATSTVLTPDGNKFLGSSGSGFAWEWKTAANYHPDKYLEFLSTALSKYNKSSNKLSLGF